MTADNINPPPLPLYAPSAPSPSYTCEPTFDEQTLQLTPRLNRPPPTGTYTKEAEKMVVTLFEQEKDAQIPTYGRCALVSGTVYLENHELISQVVLKVRWKLLVWTNIDITALSRSRVSWNRFARKQVPTLSSS